MIPDCDYPALGRALRGTLYPQLDTKLFAGLDGRRCAPYEDASIVWLDGE